MAGAGTVRCHIAAAWSAAGVLADGNGRRAGRSRASRAAAGAIRRLPRCAAPRAPIGTQHAWLPLTAVARHCAGRPASGGNDRALRQRPRGASKFRNDRSERRQHSAHMAPHVDPCTAHVQRNATLGGSWRKLWLYGKGPRRDAWCEHLDTTHRQDFFFFSPLFKKVTPVTVTVYPARAETGERARQPRPGRADRCERTGYHVTNNVCALVTRFRTGMFHAHS